MHATALTFTSTAQRRRSRQRGTATLEALLVLPVFLVIWLGILHLNKAQGSVLVARAQARSCAWRYSNAGCHGAAPSGCEDTASSTASLVAADENDHDIEGVIADLGPLGGLFEGVLGEAAHVRASKRVLKTDPLVPDDADVGADIYLLCNERNRTMKQVAKETACSLVDADTFLGSTLGCNGERTWE